MISLCVTSLSWQFLSLWYYPVSGNCHWSLPMGSHYYVIQNAGEEMWSLFSTSGVLSCGCSSAGTEGEHYRIVVWPARKASGRGAWLERGVCCSGSLWALLCARLVFPSRGLVLLLTSWTEASFRLRCKRSLSPNRTWRIQVSMISINMIQA